jgi:hypothetical protein
MTKGDCFVAGAPRNDRKGIASSLALLAMTKGVCHCERSVAIPGRSKLKNQKAKRQSKKEIKEIEIFGTKCN